MEMIAKDSIKHGHGVRFRVEDMVSLGEDFSTSSGLYSNIWCRDVNPKSEPLRRRGAVYRKRRYQFTAFCLSCFQGTYGK